jgi:hypothetical protein
MLGPSTFGSIEGEFSCGMLYSIGDISSASKFIPGTVLILYSKETMASSSMEITPPQPAINLGEHYEGRRRAASEVSDIVSDSTQGLALEGAVAVAEKFYMGQVLVSQR